MLAEVPYEPFLYIHSPEYEHHKSDVIDEQYKSIESLGSRFIVKNNDGYRVYASVHKFLEHLNNLPEQQRNYHEVIMRKEQKLKFDIDSPIEKLNNFEIPTGLIEDPQLCLTTNEEKYNHILNAIIDAVNTAFFVLYKKELTSMVICESKFNAIDAGNMITKYSNHLIIDRWKVSGPEQCQHFTRQVRDFLPDVYHPFIDMSVNKSLQNFRLIGCHKGDGRVKRTVRSNYLETDDSQLQTIITYVDDCELLPDTVTQNDDRITPMVKDLHPDDVEQVLAVCARDGIMQHNILKCCRGNMFMFKRLSAEFCSICNDEHTQDNSVMVTASSMDGLVCVFKHCRRYLFYNGKTGSHFVKIGEFISASINVINAINPLVNGYDINMPTVNGAINNGDIDVPFITRQIRKAIVDAPLAVSGMKTLFDNLDAKFVTKYDEPILRPFELASTLVVHAAMKMGKTKALREYINTHFIDGIKTHRVVILSFRQTFSGNLKEKFPDYVMYSDVVGPLNQHKLIVQVESLHRYEILEGGEPPDLLILDECESIFEQFDSGLLRGNFNSCFAKFQYLMRFSKHVVCMDAGVCDRTYRVVTALRAVTVDKPIHYHYNTHKNATADRYWLTGDKLRWLGVLYSTIEAEEKVAIPISSLMEAKILAENLGRRYPDKTVLMYSSETTQAVKKEVFGDVNTHWANADVLIYTPTVSAGVSFERVHFSKVFGYFTDQSCPIETCIQMIGRIRDVGDHSLFMYLGARGNNLPITLPMIRKQVMTKRENLMKNFDDTGLRVEYGANGEAIYHEGPYFTLWLENTRIRNLSKNSFISRFITTVSSTGATIEDLTDDVFEMNTGTPFIVDGSLNEDVALIKNEHTTVRKEIKQQSIQKILTARDINGEEMELIKADIQAQKDVTSETLSEYERFRLRECYRYYHPINEKFITKYNEPKVRLWFKNISRLMTCQNPDESIKHIQAEEAAAHKHLMEVDPEFAHHRYADLNRRYVFDRHRYAIGLLKLCGWDNINDPICQHLVTLSGKLNENERLYWETIRQACEEFNIRPPNIKQAAIYKNPANAAILIKMMLKPINQILSTMYGVTIGTTRDDTETYSITQNKLFTTDPEVSERKCVPLVRGLGPDAARLEVLY